MSELMKAKVCLIEALEEQSNIVGDDGCIYPDCDNCGFCYFRQALTHIDNALKEKGKK